MTLVCPIRGYMIDVWHLHHRLFHLAITYLINRLHNYRHLIYKFIKLKLKLKKWSISHVFKSLKLKLKLK